MFVRENTDHLVNAGFRGTYEVLCKIVIFKRLNIPEIEEEVAQILNLTEDQINEIHRESTTKLTYATRH